MQNKPKIIAVDFDGTLCENKYPEIGLPNLDLIQYLYGERKDGNKIILWTCRTGNLLTKAVWWCHGHGLYFDAVNENLPEIITEFGSDTRKIFANEYIDDLNVNSLIWDLPYKPKSNKQHDDKADAFLYAIEALKACEEFHTPWNLDPPPHYPGEFDFAPSKYVLSKEKPILLQKKFVMPTSPVIKFTPIDLDYTIEDKTITNYISNILDAIQKEEDQKILDSCTLTGITQENINQLSLIFNRPFDYIETIFLKYDRADMAMCGRRSGKNFITALKKLLLKGGPFNSSNFDQMIKLCNICEDARQEKLMFNINNALLKHEFKPIWCNYIADHKMVMMEEPCSKVKITPVKENKKLLVAIFRDGTTETTTKYKVSADENIIWFTLSSGKYQLINGEFFIFIDTLQLYIPDTSINVIGWD